MKRMLWPLLLLISLSVAYNQGLDSPAFVASLNPVVAAEEAPDYSSLSNELQVYWYLDEASGNRSPIAGTNILVESGGTVNAATGISTNAIGLPGGNTHLNSQFYNPPLLRSDLTNFTVQAWVYWSNVVDNKVLAGKWDASGEYALICLGTEIRFYLRDSNNSANVICKTGITPSAGKWYHIIGGHDYDNGKAWIQASTDAIIGFRNETNAAAGSRSSTNKFSIGDYTTAATGFNGRIDEVAFWKRTLTSNEVYNIYNSGTGRFYPW